LSHTGASSYNTEYTTLVICIGAVLSSTSPTPIFYFGGSSSSNATVNYATANQFSIGYSTIEVGKNMIVSIESGTGGTYNLTICWQTTPTYSNNSLSINSKVSG